MRRLPVLVALLAAAAALAIGSTWLTTSAQTATPMAAGPGFVGSWRLTITAPGGPSSQSLGTLLADGTFIESDEPVSPGSPVDVTSAGHGLWEQTGASTAEVTFVELSTDLKGNFLGTATINARLTLGADGNSFSGPFTVTAADPSGKVVAQVSGTVKATRIVLQPLGTPVSGTPAA